MNGIIIEDMLVAKPAKECPICGARIFRNMIDHAVNNLLLCPKCDYKIFVDTWTTDLCECSNCGQIINRGTYECRYCSNGEDPEVVRNRFKTGEYRPPRYWPKEYFIARGLI